MCGPLTLHHWTQVVKERESIRTLCDKLRRERDGAVTQLAEALNDLDAVKKTRIEVVKENRELRERIESVEKDARIRMLQRSVGQSHSRDSAIDTDLQVLNLGARSVISRNAMSRIGRQRHWTLTWARSVMMMTLVWILLVAGEHWCVADYGLVEAPDMLTTDPPPGTILCVPGRILSTLPPLVKAPLWRVNWKWMTVSCGWITSTAGMWTGAPSYLPLGEPAGDW